MSNTDFDIPVVVTAAGVQPTPPAALLADLLASVAATNPGYTATLPGSLIEDISSTDIGALIVCDAARVETINSLTPFGANDFLLLQLGQIYIGPGSAPAVPTNTSTFVVFTAIDNDNNPLPGYVIPVGFTVSDGTYQYIVQDGGVTASDGQTGQLFVQASISGSWAVPTNTVTQIVTSVPSGVNLTCSNPVAGTSGAAAETGEQYRSRVLQAGQAVSVGTQQQMKTLLGNVPGVQQRLISVVQQADGGWEVICGGGDPYLTAGAIYASGVDISTLVGSTLAVTNVTQANPGVVTTDLDHGFENGQAAEITGMNGMGPLNGVPLTITVISEKVFSVGIDTTAYPVYISGGVVTPNLRNETPNIYDYPDVYSVPYVNPPQQTVTMVVTYDTTAPNFTSQAAVAQAAGPALAAYVNTVTVGQPMNQLLLRDAFIEAVANIIPESQISVLSFAVSINGVSTPVQAGTELIFGDPESFFEATTAGIVVEQV